MKAIILILTTMLSVSTFAAESTLKCSVSGSGSDDKNVSELPIEVKCAVKDLNDPFGYAYDCKGSVQIGEATIKIWEALTPDGKQHAGSITINDSLRFVQVELKAGVPLQYASLDPKNSRIATALLNISCK